MRVLHVAAGNLYGGVERVLAEIARADVARHHSFALAFDGRVARELRVRGATVQVFGPARFSRPWSIWRARAALRAQWNLADFGSVVCHSPWSYAAAAPVLPAETCVMWAHNALDGTHWTERRIRRQPPGLVIAISEYTAATMRRWLPAARLVVVYPPVTAVGADRAARDRVRSDMQVPAGTTVILIASRFERLKGHAELLHAAATLSGAWEVWIAGAPQRPEETAYDRELHQLATTLSIDARVRFLGERTDVPRLFSAADIHCQPNASPESFGIAFVEAMSAGVPVVTTRGGGADEIVSADCGVVVTSGDRAALASALDGLVRDPVRRAALGHAGRLRARFLCDPAAQMSVLEHELSRLTGARV